MSTETIVVNGKWRSATRRVADLTPNQQGALRTHRRHLADGAPILADLGYAQDETSFTRGQPETHFTKPGAVTVYLVGLGHWQVYYGGSQVRGTREVENLAAAVASAERRAA